jgi:catechol 2,3-dioxygenase
MLRVMKTRSWPLRDLTLKVLDLSSATAFYEAFGFHLDEKSEDRAVFSAGEGPRITLKKLVNGRPRPPKTAGLFHFAVLLPDRHSLAGFARFASGHPFHFVGAADHLVSESLYFSDNEDNGIEVYADRPRAQWEWDGNTIRMATVALDFEGLLRLPGPAWAGFPTGTRLGHMHLTVGDLHRAQGCYEKLGLKLTLDWGAFRFLSWDSYHHHLAINLVEGPHAAPVTPDVAGLESFSVHGDFFQKETLDPAGISVLPGS